MINQSYCIGVVGDTTTEQDWIRLFWLADTSSKAHAEYPSQIKGNNSVHLMYHDPYSISGAFSCSSRLSFEKSVLPFTPYPASAIKATLSCMGKHLHNDDL